MGLDDLLISTGVDQLIKYLKEKGRAEIGTAAKDLKLPIRTVEDWAHVLEEEGLIAIEYKLTKIYLAWRAPSSEYVGKKAAELNAKAAQTRGDVSSLLAKVEEGGRELEAMQQEISRLENQQPITPSEIAKLKAQLSEAKKQYESSLGSSAEKLAKLKKKLDAIGSKVGAEGTKAEIPDIGKELAVLKKFESALQSQLEDTETFFSAFEARLEEFRKSIEEGSGKGELDKVKEELASLKGLRGELLGAIEAVAEEYKSIDARIAALDKRLSDAVGREGLAAEKKKLAELRKMEEDARRQKGIVTEQLQSALLSVKKQMGRLESLSAEQSAARQQMEELKNEYVDIAEEISRAGEELASRQKEIGKRISEQMALLDAAKGGIASRISKEEVQKVSFLLRELKREQALLEEKVRLLVKESELLGLAEPAAGAPKPVPAVAVAKAGAAYGEQPYQEEEGGEGAAAFVEKVKLSEEEESEFERKREELRSLIRKMWEESKGGSAG